VKGAVELEQVVENVLFSSTGIPFPPLYCSCLLLLAVLEPTPQESASSAHHSPS